MATPTVWPGPRVGGGGGVQTSSGDNRPLTGNEPTTWQPKPLTSRQPPADVMLLIELLASVPLPLLWALVALKDHWQTVQRQALPSREQPLLRP